MIIKGDFFFLILSINGYTFPSSIIYKITNLFTYIIFKVILKMNTEKTIEILNFEKIVVSKYLFFG